MNNKESQLHKIKVQKAGVQHTSAHSYLDRTGLVFVIFGVGLQVININSGETGNKQLQFLLSEDGDESLWNDLIESLQEGCQLLPYRTYTTNQSKGC